MSKEEKEKQSLYLNSCPFCGGEPLINTYQDSDDPKTYIECKICKIEGKKFNQVHWSKERGMFSDWELAKKQAIEFWNTRNNEKEKIELEEESIILSVKRAELMKEFNENLLQMKKNSKFLINFHSM